MNTLKIVGTKRRPINLFFTELIIALLFFSISGAVILNVFASADRRSRMNAEKENAIICAQSIAETYSEIGDPEEALKTVFSQSPEYDENNGVYMIRLDSYCRPAANGKISMSATEKREKTASGEMSTLTIVLAADEGELFSLVCSAYKPDGGEDGA